MKTTPKRRRRKPSVRKTMRIAMYGGKFDPIHNGHLQGAEWTREAFFLDKVLFVTSASPPHKQTGVLPAELRHEMVEATVKPNSYFEACDIEMHRTGPSYTVDTLRLLKKQLTKKYRCKIELFLIISAEYLQPDHAWRIDKWHGADELFKLAEILCFPRDAAGLTQIEEWKKNIPQARIHALHCPTPPVSSSMIRERVEQGKSVWYMIAPETWAIIRDRRHYLKPGAPLPARYYERCTGEAGNLTETSMTTSKNSSGPAIIVPGTTIIDPFAAKRAEMIEEFFGRMFMLGGMISATDTYKRTMWQAWPEYALANSAYHLTLRKGLSEPGAGDQLIMAGHEAMLAQWFHRPIKRADVELSRLWSMERSNVKAFPNEMWDQILADQPGDDIFLPVDIWGLPGGQTFLKGVPCLSFEGMGGAISYLEPAMCRYFAPIIQATKARLMKLATDRDAEFGLRAAVNEISNIVLLLARYVGGRGKLTSNDNAEFMFPELFKSIGTIGHEGVSASQSFSKSLGRAEREQLDAFVARMGNGSLLCDLVDAESVGLESALAVMKNHPDKTKVGIRVDSGDIAEQCVKYFLAMRHQGIVRIFSERGAITFCEDGRTIVFEDEVSPEMVKRIYAVFREKTGVEPTMLFPGAGGYWWRLVHRDEVSAAFKRSATGRRPNVKFSNTPGKESLPGYLRVYGRGDTLVVADKSETVDGEPLMVKLVDQGRIVYREDWNAQADRADNTWGKYTRVEISPKVQAWKDRFVAKREKEVAAARKRLARQSSGTSSRRKAS